MSDRPQHQQAKVSNDGDRESTGCRRREIVSLVPGDLADVDESNEAKTADDDLLIVFGILFAMAALAIYFWGG